MRSKGDNMNCKNFDALDDICKGCLSGGTSVNPKEQECYEEPMKMAVIGHRRQSVARQLMTFAGLINGLGEYADDDENEFEVK